MFQSSFVVQLLPKVYHFTDSHMFTFHIIFKQSHFTQMYLISIWKQLTYHVFHSYAKSKAILELLSTATKRIQCHVCLIILTVDHEIIAWWRQINRFFCFQIMFHKTWRLKYNMITHVACTLFLDSNNKFNLIVYAIIYCKRIMDYTPVNQTFKTGFIYDLSSTLNWIKKKEFL